MALSLRFENFGKPILRSFDNGTYFINSFRLLYTFNAWKSFLFPATVLALLIFMKTKVKALHRMHGWDSICFWLVVILLIAFACYRAYFGYKFWKDRKKAIDANSKKGDQIVVTPLIAHYIQSKGEAMGLTVSIFLPAFFVLMYLAILLSFSRDFREVIPFVEPRHAFLGLLVGLLLTIAAVFIFILIGYFIITISHLISERIKTRAQIANDLRDVADIQRAVNEL